jgi:MOSC domain-containing protein YiiM
MTRGVRENLDRASAGSAGSATIVVGESGVRLKITQIGKECHTKCAIFKLVGDCIMPELGVFCEVLEGGTVKVGDTIEKR